MFRHRLALALGKFVYEIEQMPQSEYAGWVEFYRRDPFGDQRADLRMAHTIWAVLAPHSKNPPKPADLMLFSDRTEIDEEDEWDAILDRAATPEPGGSP